MRRVRCALRFRMTRRQRNYLTVRLAHEDEPEHCPGSDEHCGVAAPVPGRGATLSKLSGEFHMHTHVQQLGRELSRCPQIDKRQLWQSGSWSKATTYKGGRC